MSDNDRQPDGDAIAAAFDALSLRDPRDQFREWLKSLRDADPDAFARAREYYDATLVPSLADPQADPVGAWIRYGRLLAECNDGPGAVFEIDAEGRAIPGQDRTGSALVLFLPDDPLRRARILSLPKRPSSAQRATCDLLALGKTALR